MFNSTTSLCVFCFTDHDPNTISLVSCDKLSLITYQDSNSNIIDFRIPNDYNFYMVDFFGILSYIRKITTILFHDILNLLDICSPNTAHQLFDSSVQSLVLSYDGIQSNNSLRSINSLILPRRLLSKATSRHAFILLNCNNDQIFDGNIYNLRLFKKSLNFFSFFRSFRYFLILYRNTFSLNNFFNLSFVLLLLQLSIDLIESESLFNYFPFLNSVYFYDDHNLVRGFTLL